MPRTIWDVLAQMVGEGGATAPVPYSPATSAPMGPEGLYPVVSPRMSFNGGVALDPSQVDITTFVGPNNPALPWAYWSRRNAGRVPPMYDPVAQRNPYTSLLFPGGPAGGNPWLVPNTMYPYGPQWDERMGAR